MVIDRLDRALLQRALLGGPALGLGQLALGERHTHEIGQRAKDVDEVSAARRSVAALETVEILNRAAAEVARRAVVRQRVGGDIERRSACAVMPRAPATPLVATPPPVVGRVGVDQFGAQARSDLVVVEAGQLSRVVRRRLELHGSFERSGPGRRHDARPQPDCGERSISVPAWKCVIPAPPSRRRPLPAASRAPACSTFGAALPGRPVDERRGCAARPARAGCSGRARPAPSSAARSARRTSGSAGPCSCRRPRSRAVPPLSTSNSVSAIRSDLDHAAVPLQAAGQVALATCAGRDGSQSPM